MLVGTIHGAREIARVDVVEVATTARRAHGAPASRRKAPSHPCTSRRAVNFDAVPKDLDRIIDAALDRGMDILWDNARHRAPMQITADQVEKLHGDMRCSFPDR